MAAGFTAEELDSVPFTVNYHTWVCAHWGGKYYISIEARNASHTAIAQSNIGTSSSPITLPNDSDNWYRTIKQNSDTFVVSTTGVRYIYLKVGGKDTRNWSGNFGTRFDDNYVGINNAFDPPALATDSATDIGSNSAIGNGSTITLGIDNPTAHGHCWNQTGMPTLDDSFNNLGSINRIYDYNSTLSGLSPNTTYYVRSYATNSAGTGYGPESQFKTMTADAMAVHPQTESAGVETKPTFTWTAPENGCDGYLLSIWSESPVATILSNHDLGNAITYEMEYSLLYNTTYYWRVDTYNSIGTHIGPVWSFSVTDIYQADLTEVITGNPVIPVIMPSIVLSSVSGEYNPVITAGWNLPGAPDHDNGLYIHIGGLNLADGIVGIYHRMGFIPDELSYQVEPSQEWVTMISDESWTGDYAWFTYHLGKANGDMTIVFPSEGESTLPVELSSFMATVTQGNNVKLTWITQSESNLSGYRVYRNSCNDLATSEMVSPLIPSSNSSTIRTYNYLDEEMLDTGNYYYWLESLELDGNSVFFGGINVTLNNDNHELPPAIPQTTLLMNAEPNPFNPNTRLYYQMANAGEVRMDIFNARGQYVKSFENNHGQPGKYWFTWDGTDASGHAVSSGLYLYRMSSGRYSATKKMILMK